MRLTGREARSLIWEDHDKMIMFELAKQTNEDLCCRCGQRIKSLDTFSIEHIEPWLDSNDPVEKFFDLDNIAFSHIKCNIDAASRRTTSRLTQNQVVEIKMLLRNGELSQRAIARKFGVDHDGRSKQC
jgi:hypothetical protein